MMDTHDGYEKPSTAMLRVFGATLAALAALLGAHAAAAAPVQCTTRDEVGKELEKRFAEVPVSFGLASSGRLFEVFSTKDGATWTLVITAPDGISCILAAGRFWEHRPVTSHDPQASIPAPHDAG